MKTLFLLLITFAAQAQQVNDSTFLDLKLPVTVSEDYSIRPLFDMNGHAYRPENEGLDISIKKIDSAGTKITVKAPGYLVFVPVNEGLFNVKVLFKTITDLIVDDLDYGAQTPWGEVKRGQYMKHISNRASLRTAEGAAITRAIKNGESSPNLVPKGGRYWKVKIKHDSTVYVFPPIHFVVE